MGSNDEQFFKIVITGGFAVGKSSLVIRYVDGTFTKDAGNTLGVDYKIKENVKVGDRSVKMKICDTAGQERFRTVTASFYRNVHAVIFVYDVTNRESFDGLNHWTEEAKLFAPEDICTFLVGNKVWSWFAWRNDSQYSQHPIYSISLLLTILF